MIAKVVENDTSNILAVISSIIGLRKVLVCVVSELKTVSFDL